MKRYLPFIIILSVYYQFASWVQAAPIEIQSPNGTVSIRCEVGDRGEIHQGFFYSLTYLKQPVIQGAFIGFDLQNAPGLLGGWKIDNQWKKENLRSYSPVYGQRKSIPDRYNQVEIQLREIDESRRTIRVTFRAYDEGIAFRVVFDGNGEHVIASEKTQFRFVKNFNAYEEHGTEGEYHKVPIDDIKPKCETPLTIELEGGRYACVMEADVYDYPRMWLSPDDESPNTLTAHLGGPVRSRVPFSTPWRVILLGGNPAELTEHSYLVMNLNPPCAIEDTSWIKPGTVIRCTTLNTQGGKDYINFAAEHKIDYVHFDAGWYGPERDDDSDARKPKADLDLRYLIDYAKERRIGITVYVNRRALERQLDDILPLYRKWGIKGIKFGFVRVGTQEQMKWLRDAVEKCAKYQMIVDIHDSYRPNGMSRTFPNLLTQEGIRGNEHMPTAEHNVTLPFTRYPAGAGDYTICYYSNRIKTTHAHQLAASIVMYSPLKFLMWYDKPSNYQGEPEIELFENLPSVWDESRVLHGEIGDYVTIARRQGEMWYVGCMTDENARTLIIPLSFLDERRPYIANVYRDALGSSRTGVAIERIPVDSETDFEAKMAPSGGCALWIVPQVE